MDENEQKTNINYEKKEINYMQQEIDEDTENYKQYKKCKVKKKKLYSIQRHQPNTHLNSIFA